MTDSIGDSSAADSGSVLLRVTDLRTCLVTGGVTAYPVDGVSFELRHGDTLAVVGESGSGKSMTALSLMGLLPRGVISVASGRAELDGRDLLALRPRDMRRMRGLEIAYMPQDPVSALNPALPIGRQVAEALLVHRTASKQEAQARAGQLLRRMGLPNMPQALRAYPHQLSGGMRQRVVLAMALIGNPKVLIADEPTTALDVTTQEQIIELLMELQCETRLGLILITHDMGVVARIATDVLVMYAGKPVEHGKVDTVFDSPTHPYTRGLLESVSFEALAPRTTLRSIEGTPPALDDLPGGCSFRPRCRHAIDVCRSEPPALTGVPGSASVSACHVARSGALPPFALGSPVGSG
jgi:oligopeptide/dipeptide ABC transporter ATP-binding protein